MHFLDKRVNVICEELKKLKVKQKFAIDEWSYKEGNYIHPEDAEKDLTPWESFDCRNMHWYGKDRHYWFKAVYRVPQELDGKRMWMHVRTQIDEWDDAKNPQFLLFVNGEAVQGIDMNHRDVFLRPQARAGEELTLELQAYTGILHTEFNLIVEMQEIDCEIEKLYYDLWVPLAAFSRMEEDDKNRRDIEEILNTTVNFLDLRTPYSEEFYRTLREATGYIGQALYTDHAGYKDVIATCIGHTHIDVAWWWTVEQTREKVGRSFATVLKLMEEYPNYKFMSSQPQLYAFLKERYPELYAKAKVPDTPFPVVTLKELYRGLEQEFGYTVEESEKGDLTTDAERLSFEWVKKHYGHEFLFVTDYSAQKRAFYHMRDENGVPQGYDLVWRGVEITTGAQREHRWEVLKKQAEEKGLAEDVKFYLEFFRYGCPPHGGFGIGVDRLTMLLMGLTIKDAMFLFRGPNRLTP